MNQVSKSKSFLGNGSEEDGGNESGEPTSISLERWICQRIPNHLGKDLSCGDPEGQEDPTHDLVSLTEIPPLKGASVPTERGGGTGFREEGLCSGKRRWPRKGCGRDPF
ncbi:hypothetical protein N665_0858s0005 [Sinapis alba]|nr:hypothetical protein N665_0858s0005 [Sinapis alba]